MGEEGFVSGSRLRAAACAGATIALAVSIASSKIVPFPFGACAHAAEGVLSVRAVR
jgi:hypothetical protein